MIRRLGISPADSLLLLALYWAALLVGRLVAQLILKRVNRPLLLLGSIVSALMGTIVLSSTNNLFGAIMGVLFVIAGIVGLVHPQWQGRDHKMPVELAGQSVIVNTRRVIDVPPLFCGAIIVMGICVVMLGFITEAKKKYPEN